jgi:hypothetical protein
VAPSTSHSFSPAPLRSPAPVRSAPSFPRTHGGGNFRRR